MSVICRLIRMREKAGLTQAELAALLGWSQSAVSKFEATPDRNLKLVKVAAYAAAFGKGTEIRMRRRAASGETGRPTAGEPSP